MTIRCDCRSPEAVADFSGRQVWLWLHSKTIWMCVGGGDPNGTQGCLPWPTGTRRMTHCVLSPRGPSVTIKGYNPLEDNRSGGLGGMIFISVFQVEIRTMSHLLKSSQRQDVLLFDEWNHDFPFLSQSLFLVKVKNKQGDHVVFSKTAIWWGWTTHTS